jgi:HK97 family phage prohead protease
MLHKTFEIKAAEDGRMIASTPDVDRDKDRVIATGARLDNFLKNPVLMYGHNYRDPWALIGKAADLQVDAGGINFQPELREPANDSDPMTVIRALWDQKLLRAASIGFNPTKWMENEVGGRDFVEWELLEISIVPIPANQNALRLAAKAIDGGGEELATTQPVQPVVEPANDGDIDEGVLLALAGFLETVGESMVSQ